MSAEGVVEALTAEADGVKFGLTDGIDVAEDGAVYFTDASSKYGFHNFIYDILEGRPLGRLMRYDPNTELTEILAAHLYFANGVALDPTRQFLVFCETPLYVLYCILSIKFIRFVSKSIGSNSLRILSRIPFLIEYSTFLLLILFLVSLSVFDLTGEMKLVPWLLLELQEKMQKILHSRRSKRKRREIHRKLTRNAG